MNSIISRIKIESALNIAEKRLPQDGRITKKIAGKSFDIRVSTIPTSRGYERIVMRLLNKSSVLLDLPDLGFSPREYALMDGLIRRPDGIILVTGPTGSGKTTTLYACINRINQPNLNILTAEDPVEYEIQGIHQVHVQPKIGLTFASALRAFLRQDPDIVMVGEIRDTETLEIAINASLTGHLVLSTIHTNDAAGADHAHDRHGRRAVPAALERHRHPRAAPRARALPALQVPVRGRGLRARGARAHGGAHARCAPRGATTRARATSRATSARATCSRRSIRAAAASFYKAQGCDQCTNTGLHRAGAASTSCCSIDDAVGPLILQKADSAGHQARCAWEQGMDTPARRRRAQGARRDDDGRGGPRGDAGRRRGRAAGAAAVAAPSAGARRGGVSHGRLRVPRDPVGANGKQVHGVRDADNAKSLRAALKREGILLTSAQEETKAQKGGRPVDSRPASLFRRVSVARRRDDDPPARDAGHRGHPAGRVRRRAHRAGREARAQARPHAGASTGSTRAARSPRRSSRTRTSSRTST